MPSNSAEIVQKLAALDPPATALLDSTFVKITGPDGKFQKEKAELVATDRGRYISSPVDGWQIHPYDGD